jgi:hypothetical protein
MKKTELESFYEWYKERNALTRRDVILELVNRISKQERTYTKEDICQFGLWLGDTFNKSKGKSIDVLLKEFENL